jgi:hypothetical protein
LYGIIRHELHNVATSTLDWAEHLRASFPTISLSGGFSYVDLTVLATTLDQDLPDYERLKDEFVPSHAATSAALAPRMICLQVLTPDALNRPSNTKGHLYCGISRNIKARAFLNLLAICDPSPTDYMRVVSGTGSEALAMFFASHKSSFHVPSHCYMMAARRVLGLTPGHALHVRKWPRCNESRGAFRGSGSFSLHDFVFFHVWVTPIFMPHAWTISPVALAHIMLFDSMIALFVF